MNLSKRTIPLVLLSLSLAASFPAGAQTFTVLHYFTGGNDGGTPIAGLTIDRNGNLYGDTNYGGNTACRDAFGTGCGVVYKLYPHGSSWIISPLYLFAGIPDGASPSGEVTIAADGTIYGETGAGGILGCSTNGSGCGTVFRLRPFPNWCLSISCLWNETVLYRFTGGSDGGVPTGNVVVDGSGNVYGNTQSGGINSNGLVYKLAPSQGGWTESVVHAFTAGDDGSGPSGGLVADANGHLAGVTGAGGGGLNCGDSGCGTVFGLAPSGSGWQETILHAFQQSEGGYPVGGVTLDSAGNLYGSYYPGLPGVFELAHSNGGWTLMELYSGLGFSNLPAVTNPPITDRAGNVYGAAVFGGDFTNCVYGCGYVYKLTPSPGGWIYSVLHNFTFNDGQAPWGRMVLDAEGNLYGTTVQGGQGGANCYDGCGTLWKIAP